MVKRISIFILLLLIAFGYAVTSLSAPQDSKAISPVEAPDKPDDLNAWLDVAIANVQEISDPAQKANALYTLANMLKNARRVQEAGKCFADAVAIVQKTENPGIRDMSLRDMAISQAWGGFPSEAKKTADAIQNELFKAYALANAAKAQGRAGKIEDAARTFSDAIAALKDEPEGGDWSHSTALRDIAKAEAEVGMFDKAVETAKKSRQLEVRAYAFQDIARVYSKADRIPDAVKMADKLDDSGDKAYFLCAIASELMRVWRQHDDAVKVFSDATQAALKIGNAKERAYALGNIVESQAFAYMIEDAEWTAKKIEDAQEKAWAFIKIARREMDSHNLQAVARIASKALPTAREIGDNENKTSSLCTVAELLANAGAAEDASKIFSEAVIAANAIASRVQKASWLAHIASAQASANQTDNARKTFASAIECARKIEEDGGQYNALLSIVDAGASSHMFTEALIAAEMITYPEQRKDALHRISNEQARVGMFAESIETAKKAGDVDAESNALRYKAQIQAERGMFKEAFETLSRIKDSGREDNVLKIISQRQNEAGLFDDAVATAQKMQNARGKCEAILDIACAQAHKGKTEEAAKSISLATDLANKVNDARDKEYLYALIARNLAEADLTEALARTFKALQNETAYRRAQFCLGVVGGFMSSERNSQTTDEIVRPLMSR